MMRVYDRVVVLCSRCGKELVGNRGLRGYGIRVRKHKMANRDGWTCDGHLYADHREKT